MTRGTSAAQHGPGPPEWCYQRCTARLGTLTAYQGRPAPLYLEGVPIAGGPLHWERRGHALRHTPGPLCPLCPLCRSPGPPSGCP